MLSRDSGLLVVMMRIWPSCEATPSMASNPASETPFDKELSVPVLCHIRRMSNIGHRSGTIERLPNDWISIH